MKNKYSQNSKRNVPKNINLQKRGNHSQNPTKRKQAIIFKIQAITKKKALSGTPQDKCPPRATSHRLLRK